MNYDDFKRKFINYNSLEEEILNRESKKIIRYLKEHREYKNYINNIYELMNYESSVFHCDEKNDSFDNFTLIGKSLIICVIYTLTNFNDYNFKKIEISNDNEITLPDRYDFYKHFYCMFFSLFLDRVISNDEILRLKHFYIWEK